MSARTWSYARIRALPDIVLIAAASLVPFLWRLALDVGRTPAGDAWAYERIFDTYERTGDVVLVGWNDITLVGMLPITKAWVSIFDYGPHQLHVLGAVMTAVGLLGFRHLLVSAGVVQRTFALAVMGTFYGLITVTGTYLSDPFFFAGAMWAVALAVRLVAAAPTSSGWLVAYAVGAGLCAAYAFSVRQHALAVVAAIVVLLWQARGERPRAWWLFCIAFALPAIPVYLWRDGLEHGGEVMIELHARTAASAVISMWFVLGLLALPYAARAGPLRRVPPLVAAVACLPFGGLVAGGLFDGARPLAEGHSFIGDLVVYGGALGWLLALVAAAAATWSWVIVVTAPRPAGRVHAAVREAFFAIVVLEVIGTVVTSGYFPRYSLVSGAVLVCMLAAAVESDQGAGSIVTRRDQYARIALVAALGLGSFWVLDRSIAPTRALDEAADVAECAGIAPEELDGGFVWNGVHSSAPVDSHMDEPVLDDGLPATDEQRVFLDMQRRAVIVSSEPAANDDLATVGPFRASGALPGTSASLWIVAHRDLAGALERCEAGG